MRSLSAETMGGVTATFGESAANVLSAALRSVGALQEDDARDVSALVEPPFVDLLEVRPGEDYRGHLLVAGYEALSLPFRVSSDIARRATRMWVSSFGPAARLRVYAAVLSATDVVAVGGASPPEFLERLGTLTISKREYCSAWRWDKHALAEVGQMHGDRVGRGALATVQVKSRSSYSMTGRRSWEVIGLSACPNLASLVMEDRTEPRDTCCGVDWELADAEARCLSEGTERFTLGDPPAKTLRYESAKGLGSAYLDPRRIAAYAASQIIRQGIGAFDEETSAWWTEGRSARDGLTVWVPAALVWSPFPRPPWLAPGIQTTNGVAAHPNAVRAAQHAWLELVERDAFLRCWWSRRPPERLEVPAGPAASLAGWLAGRDVELHIIRLPATHGIFAAGAVALHAGGVRIGCAAGPPLQAVEKALAEVSMLHRWPPRLVEDATQVRTPEDHAGLWAGGQAQQRLRWLLEGDIGPVPTSDLPASWTSSEECPDPECVLVDLPASEPGGLHVTRALSSSLLPLTFGFDTEPRAHPAAHHLEWPEGPAFPHPLA